MVKLLLFPTFSWVKIGTVGKYAFQFVLMAHYNLVFNNYCNRKDLGEKQNQLLCTLIHTTQTNILIILLFSWNVSAHILDHIFCLQIVMKLKPGFLKRFLRVEW